ncbi:hypothetical protein BCF74_11239 [Knoellia remsis]|uniref:Asp23/Gls24 family envelope stress response protein n=1 Tax=Knoellia remsis TaxID=407159 RepID=A0A2T0UJX4_9MICO|nr:hypothetical protein [Knoellia remsis]PRY58222.1 hypothetical protein BCF74_11239 [Knoellia remsis]
MPIDPDTDAEITDEATEKRYRELVDTVVRQWNDLEAAGDRSVQLSAEVLTGLKDAVRADARHGPQVEMPPTDAGPWTTSELALRTLVRHAVDAVPDALSLRTSFDYADGEGRTRGRPDRITCRISASTRTPNLPALGEAVRTAVATACQDELALAAPAIDVHIEDLHER